MAITRTPIIDDDGTCTTGTIWNNAWKTELYNQIDAVDDAAWQTGPALSLTNDSGTTQTVSVLINRYRKLGSTAVIWNVSLNPITVSAPTGLLYVILTAPPFILTAPAGTVYPVAWSFGGTHLNAVHGSAVSLALDTGANFAAGSQWAYWSVVMECAPP